MMGLANAGLIKSGDYPITRFSIIPGFQHSMSRCRLIASKIFFANGGVSALKC